MSINVEITNKLTPEMQDVADCREAVQKAMIDVEEKQSALKGAKAALETCTGAMNEAIDVALKTARQPSLFSPGSEIPVNTPDGGDGGGGAAAQGPRTVVSETVEPVPSTAGVLALPPAVDREKDHTARYEAMFASGEHEFGDDHVQQMQEQIAEFRDAFSSIDDSPMPKWGRWCEFDVTLDDDTIVEVLYQPNWMGDDMYDRVEFFGAVGDDGHAVHEERWDDRRPKQLPLSEWAREIAMKLASEHARGKKGAGKRRKTATA